MFDGTLKFDTAIDKTGFQLGLSSLGSIAKTGLAAVTGAFTAAGAGVAALGGYAVSVGKDFEGSMAQVIATMGVTKDTIQDGVNSYELLKEAAAAAGESTTFSASEAADALNYLALAGYDAAKAADALPAVLNLAAAGGMDLAYASDLATDAMAALGIEATSGNLTRFGDEMAKTASKANTSVSQLGEAILTVGGTAKSLAGGTTELNAALGVLANRGIKGSEGGTALRNMILALSAPTDKAAEALEGLGVKAFDAEGNLRPLNEVFKELDTALSGMSDGEKTQVLNEIFNKVDLKSAQAMLAGCGDEFDDLTTALEGCDGAMADMAHTMNDTLEGDIKSLQSKAEAFGIAIFDNLNTPLRDLAKLGGDYVSQLTAAFKEGGFEGLADSLGDVLSSAVAKLSGYVPKIADIAVSVVTSLISGLRENIPEISDAALEAATKLVYGIADASGELLKLGGTLIKSLVSGIAEHIPDVADALQGLLKEIPEIFSGETLDEIAGAAVALVSALALGMSDTLPILLDTVLSLISALGNAILDNIPVLLPALYEFAASIIEFLADGIPQVLEAAQELITKGLTEVAPQVIEIIGKELPKVITALAKAVPQIETALAEIIPEIVQTIAESTPVIVKAIADTLPDVLTALIDGLEEMYPAVHEAVVTLITSLAELMPVIQEVCSELTPMLLASLVEMLVTIAPQLSELSIGLTESLIKSLFEIAVSLIGNYLKAVGQSLAEVGDILSDVLIDAKETALTGVQSIVSNVMEWIDTLPERMGDTLGNVLGTLATWAVEAPEKAKNGAKELVNNVSDYMKQLPMLAKEQFDRTIDKLRDWASDLVSKGRNAASDLTDTVKNGMSSLPSKMAEAGRNLVEGLWNGITGAGDWLRGKISDFGSGIIDGFKESFGIHSPSTVMRDQVGRYIAEGIGVGFAENMPDLSEIAQQTVNELDSLDIPDISQAFEFTFPDVQMPAISSPDFDIPDFEIPELSINTPEIELPELEIKADIPQIDTPELEFTIPEIEVPEIEISVADIADALMNSDVDWDKYADQYWKVSDAAEEMLYNIKNGNMGNDKEGVAEYFYWDYDMSPEDIEKAFYAVAEAIKTSAEAIDGTTIEGSIEAPDIPQIDAPELSIDTPELELKVPDIDVPEIEIPVADIVDALMNSGVDWSKYDDLYWQVSDMADDILYNIKNGNMENDKEGVAEYFYWDYDMAVSDIETAFEAISESIRLSAEKISNADIQIEDSEKVPVIDASALAALNAQSMNINSSFIQPAAVSEVVNNSYTYNSTPDGRSAPESVTGLTINANFAVGEEVVAEGVKTIILNEVDKQQGIDIQLKKRGVTR